MRVPILIALLASGFSTPIASVVLCPSCGNEPCAWPAWCHLPCAQPSKHFEGLIFVPFAHWKIFSVAGLALSQFQDLNNKNLGTSWSFSSGLCVPVLGRVDRLYPWLSLHYTVNEMWRACCSQHGNARPPAALRAVFWYLEPWVWITDDRIFLLGYVCHSHCTQKYCVCVSHSRIYVRAFSCRIFAFH